MHNKSYTCGAVSHVRSTSGGSSGPKQFWGAPDASRKCNVRVFKWFCAAHLAVYAATSVGAVECFMKKRSAPITIPVPYNCRDSVDKVERNVAVWRYKSVASLFLSNGMDTFRSVGRLTRTHPSTPIRQQRMGCVSSLCLAVARHHTCIFRLSVKRRACAEVLYTTLSDRKKSLSPSLTASFEY